MCSTPFSTLNICISFKLHRRGGFSVFKPPGWFLKPLHHKTMALPTHAKE